MARVNAGGPPLLEQFPARTDHVRILGSDHRRVSQVTGEHRTIIEQQGNAVLRVAWSMEYLACNAEALKEWPTLAYGNDYVAIPLDLCVAICGLVNRFIRGIEAI